MTLSYKSYTYTLGSEVDTPKTRSFCQKMTLSYKSYTYTLGSEKPLFSAHLECHTRKHRKTLILHTLRLVFDAHDRKLVGG